MAEGLDKVCRIKVVFEDGLISEDGLIANESTRTFLQNYMAGFHGFIARVYTVLPRNSQVSA